MFNSFIYVRSPPWAQELLISARAGARRVLREGKAYKALLAAARVREQWSSEQLDQYQTAMLRHVLEYAAKNVPYYSKQFERLDFSPSEAGLRGTVSKLPVLTKHDVVEAGEALVSKGRRSGRIRADSSGTTGTPLSILQDLPAINREKAFTVRQLSWAGFRPGESRAWLRGDMVVPIDDISGPFWRMNRIENTLMMSSYHLSEGTAATYLRGLCEFKPKIIQAYPSSISFLARYLHEQDEFYSEPSLHAIVTSSETLMSEDRRLIEERFRCRVFDWYGAVERVAAIGTCEEGSYHLLTDYSFVELEPVGDGLFELVGTGFSNLLMPLIRYRSGDLVELSEERTECRCGRAFPVIRTIHGRRDDFIKLPDGRRIGRLSQVFKGINGIGEAQLVQDELNVVRILVVPYKAFTAEEQRALANNVRQRLGTGIQINIEIVPGIARTATGKRRTVVCNV